MKHVLMAAVGAAVGFYLAKQYCKSAKGSASKLCTSSPLGAGINFATASIIGAGAGAFIGWKYL